MMKHAETQADAHLLMLQEIASLRAERDALAAALREAGAAINVLQALVPHEGHCLKIRAGVANGGRCTCKYAERYVIAEEARAALARVSA